MGRFVRVRDFEADLLAQPIPAGAYIVIATHSHAQDGAALAGALAIMAEILMVKNGRGGAHLTGAGK